MVLLLRHSEIFHIVAASKFLSFSLSSPESISLIVSTENILFMFQVF